MMKTRSEQGLMSWILLAALVAAVGCASDALSPPSPVPDIGVLPDMSSAPCSLTGGGMDARVVDPGGLLGIVSVSHGTKMETLGTMSIGVGCRDLLLYWVPVALNSYQNQGYLRGSLGTPYFSDLKVLLNGNLTMPQETPETPRLQSFTTRFVFPHPIFLGAGTTSNTRFVGDIASFEDAQAELILAPYLGYIGDLDANMAMPEGSICFANNPGPCEQQIADAGVPDGGIVGGSVPMIKGNVPIRHSMVVE